MHRQPSSETRRSEAGARHAGHTSRILHSALCLAAVAAITATAAEPEPTDRGEFRLPPVFSDHMVIQQGVIIPVWGEGPNANFRISCRLADKETWAHSDNRRHLSERKNYRNEFWCFLPPMKAGGPYELVLSNEVTHAYKTIHDVWIGEVWLASGQSNMAFEMASAKPGFGSGTNAQLRIYKGGNEKGAWDVATPKDVARHTAVGTFFGRDLQEGLGCAVGILDISCGGTCAGNWMTRGALKACPATKAWIDAYETSQSDPETWKTQPRDKDYPVDLGRAAETKDWAKTGIDLSEWVVADMPTDYTHAFGRPSNGAAWFRRDIDIPGDWVGKDLVLRLPAIDKHDITYFNDVEVGRTGKDRETQWWSVDRVYTVPASLVKAGRATIAVRVWSWVFGAGFAGGEQHFSIGPVDGPALELAGDWHARFERDVGNRSEDIRPKARTYPDGMTIVRPSSWYWIGLEPVIPYPIKGAVWYQGESNAQTPEMASQYAEVLAAMVADWRQLWGLGDFPFCIVQLPNYAQSRRHERNSSWAELRDRQLEASRKIPNVGIVNAIDLGEAYNIHPVNKLDVARRLGRWALCEVYGKGDGRPYTGPRYLSGEVEVGGRVRVRFTEAEGGIVADGAVESMFIRGEDGVWHRAKTEIDGETLVVSSPDVPLPVEVRYGWATNPIGATLKGKATGIPMFPFRWLKPTDQQ